MFFTDGDTELKLQKKSDKKVVLPTMIDHSQFFLVLAFLGYGRSASLDIFVKKLFAKTRQLKLEAACSVIRYAVLAGTGVDYFFEHWFPTIIEPDTSLFTLSQYFFAKNRRAFFKLWATVKDDYVPIFWVSFWSEQVWRAAQYVQLKQQGQQTEARKIGFRLPFSFLQRDWRQLNVDELEKAHHLLYSTDFMIKNGSNPSLLEFVYVNFFGRS